MEDLSPIAHMASASGSILAAVCIESAAQQDVYVLSSFDVGLLELVLYDNNISQVWMRLQQACFSI